MKTYGCGSIKKNGVYDEIFYILQKKEKNIVEFSEIMPNPSYGKVMEGIRLARENRVELILAGGSGSECNGTNISRSLDFLGRSGNWA